MGMVRRQPCALTCSRTDRAADQGASLRPEFLKSPPDANRLRRAARQIAGGYTDEVRALCVAREQVSALSSPLAHKVLASAVSEAAAAWYVVGLTYVSANTI